jgi:aminopeptidase N
MQRLFFSELLHAHETAHQWWGNMVTSASYQDEWLMEGLASYMSMMLLEKKKGRKAFDEVLLEYRDHLLSKDEQDRTIESAGPIVWGQRLLNSQTPQAWRTITYEKGSWILHMLRMRLGDAAFDKMLGELVQRYRYKSLTTENFRSVAAEFMPRGSDDPKLEAFFEQWVYGTGIPSLKISHTVTGRAPKVRVRGTVTQSGVPEDFSASVPVEVQVAGRKPVVTWVRTSSEPVQFTVDLPRPPTKIVMAPAHAVLMSKN